MSWLLINGKPKLRLICERRRNAIHLCGPAKKVKIRRVTEPHPPKHELIYPRTFAVVSFLVLKKGFWRG